MFKEISTSAFCRCLLSLALLTAASALFGAFAFGPREAFARNATCGEFFAFRQAIDEFDQFIPPVPFRAVALLVRCSDEHFADRAAMAWYLRKNPSRLPALEDALVEGKAKAGRKLGFYEIYFVLSSLREADIDLFAVTLPRLVSRLAPAFAGDPQSQQKKAWQTRPSLGLIRALGIEIFRSKSASGLSKALAFDFFASTHEGRQEFARDETLPTWIFKTLAQVDQWAEAQRARGQMADFDGEAGEGRESDKGRAERLPGAVGTLVSAWLAPQIRDLETKVFLGAPIGSRWRDLRLVAYATEGHFARSKNLRWASQFQAFGRALDLLGQRANAKMSLDEGMFDLFGYRAHSARDWRP
jgi:hypothetical protein